MTDSHTMKLADRIAEGVILCIIILAVYALVGASDTQGKDQQSYVRDLERVVATCLQRGDNKIVIGGELYLCGATPTGVKL